MLITFFYNICKTELETIYHFFTIKSLCLLAIWRLSCSSIIFLMHNLHLQILFYGMMNKADGQILLINKQIFCYV